MRRHAARPDYRCRSFEGAAARTFADVQGLITRKAAPGPIDERDAGQVDAAVTRHHGEHDPVCRAAEFPRLRGHGLRVVGIEEATAGQNDASSANRLTPCRS